MQRAAARIPPLRPVLPHHPDIAFTPKQRDLVIRQTTGAIRTFANQQGLHPAQAVHVLQTQGGPQARQQLKLYRRAYDENRALAFRARTGKTTGNVQQDSKLLTAFTNRSKASPGAKPRGFLGTLSDVIYGAGVQSLDAKTRPPDIRIPGATGPAAGINYASSSPASTVAGPNATQNPVANIVRSGGPAMYVTAKAGQAVSSRFHRQLMSAGVSDNVITRSLQDAVDIPAQTVPSTIYAVNHPIAAGKAYLKTDPLALALQGKLSAAKNAASQHPGVAAIELLSGVRAVDNAAGFFDRGRRVATPVRHAQNVPGTPITHNVYEPKGYVAARYGRYLDRKNAEFVTKTQEKARQAARDGNFKEARRLRLQAANADKTRLPEQEIKRRVNEFQAQGEPRRRQDAAVVDHALPEFNRPGEEAATLVRTQGISHASKSDLNALVSELEYQHDHGGLSGPQKAANQELRTRLQQYVDGGVDQHVIDAKAKQYAAVVNPITHELINRGMLTSESATYVPFAVKHGFVHSAERLRSPEYIAHLDAKVAAGRASSAERQALRRYEIARRKTIKQAAVAERAVGTPAQFFHGTPSDFNGLPTAKGMPDPLGVFLAKDRKYAAEYAAKEGQQGRILGVNVDTKNVLDLRRATPAVQRQMEPVVAAMREKVAALPADRNLVGLSRDRAVQALDAYRAELRAGKMHPDDFHEMQRHLTDISHEVGRTSLRDAFLSQGHKAVRLHDNGQDSLVALDESILHTPDRLPASAGAAARKATARLEKVRGNEALLERQYRKAQATAAEAARRSSESKPPKGSRYRQAGFAPPDVAPRLAEMGRLREEAKVAREMQRQGVPGARERAVNLEKSAAAIRNQVERLPAPRISGQELIDTVAKSMREHGYPEDTIAFVTQKPGLSSAGAYFTDWTEPRGIGGPHRTGEATVTGALPSHEGVLRENARRLQGLVSASDNFRAFVDEFFLRDPKNGGGVATLRTVGAGRDAARKMMFDAEGHPIPGAYEWTVVRLNPWAGRQEQLASLLDNVNAEGLIDGIAAHDGSNPVFEGILEALDTHALPADTPGEFGLAPKAAIDQMLAHTKILNPSDGLKALRFLNTAFRKTVLATSVPWITGNLVEGLLRAGIERTGPQSYQRMQAVLAALERINPSAAAELNRRAFGGGQAGLVEKGTIYTAADQFRDSNPFLREVALRAAMLRRTPGIKQLGDYYKAYTDWVFHSVNHSMEARIQIAIAGRKLFPEMGTVNKQAIEDAARGLTNTPAQIELARLVRRAYGQYDAFGTSNRQIIMLYTPFVAWSLNAVKFLTNVLPKDHPALTAAIAATYNASKDWRESRHMSIFINGALPGFLQGSYPGRGGQIRVSRYTPFGIADDLGGNFASLILPQYHSALYALDGLTWTGNRIKGSDGKPVTDPLHLMAIAAGQLGLSSVPVANQLMRFLQGGGSPKALLDIVDPLKPIKSKSIGGPSSSSSWGSASGTHSSSSGGGGWGAAAGTGG